MLVSEIKSAISGWW